MRASAAFPIATSSFGTQNFVRSGWAEFSEAHLKGYIAKEMSRGIAMPAPRLLLLHGPPAAHVPLAMLLAGPPAVGPPAAGPLWVVGVLHRALTAVPDR